MKEDVWISKPKKHKNKIGMVPYSKKLNTFPQKNIALGYWTPSLPPYLPPKGYWTPSLPPKGYWIPSLPPSNGVLDSLPPSLPPKGYWTPSLPPSKGVLDSLPTSLQLGIGLPPSLQRGIGLPPSLPPSLPPKGYWTPSLSPSNGVLDSLPPSQYLALIQTVVNNFVCNKYQAASCWASECEGLIVTSIVRIRICIRKLLRQFCNYQLWYEEYINAKLNINSPNCYVLGAQDYSKWGYHLSGDLTPCI